MFSLVVKISVKWFDLIWCLISLILIFIHNCALIHYSLSFSIVNKIPTLILLGNIRPPRRSTWLTFWKPKDHQNSWNIWLNLTIVLTFQKSLLINSKASLQKLWSNIFFFFFKLQRKWEILKRVKALISLDLHSLTSFSACLMH